MILLERFQQTCLGRLKGYKIYLEHKKTPTLLTGGRCLWTSRATLPPYVFDGRSH